MAVIMVMSLLPASVSAAGEEMQTWADAVTEAPAGYRVDNGAKTVSISSAEGLVWFAKEINSWESKTDKVSFAGYTIEITEDIDLSGRLWIPIDASTVKLDGVTEQQKIDRDQTYGNKLLAGATIDGNGHTISNMVVKTTVRGPRYESVPGDGQNSYYYAGFIGRTTGDLTITDLTFEGASVDASGEQFVEDHGGSSMAVVSGYYGGGTLTLDQVTISNCFVDGMQKVGGYVGQCGGSVTIQKCAVVDSTFRSLYQCAPVLAYAMNNQYNNDDSKKTNTLAINGVKLENNEVVIVKEEGTTYKTFGDNVDTWFYREDDTYNYWCGNQADAVLIAQAKFSPVSETDAVADVPLMMSAEVGGYQYDSLSAAIAAAEAGDTVTLLKDVQEAVTVGEDKEITLDLNGNVLSGDKEVKKPAILNQGTLTICDTSAEQSGLITRYDEGQAGYYVIDNQGTLTIESGFIGNQTGTMPNGSSLVRNAGNGKSATLNIKGGTLYQDGFIAVKNDDLGVLNVTGGHIYTTGDTASNTASAIQNWGTAVIAGGTIGNLWASTWSEAYESTMTISGDVTMSGRLIVKKDDASLSNAPKVTIEGGKFDAEFRVSNDGELVISGGHFTSDPSAYVSESCMTMPGEVAGYAFAVGAKTETEVKPATGDPVLGEGSIQDEAAQEAAKGTAADAGALAAAANLAIGEVTPEQQAAAESAIKADPDVAVPDDKPVYIYAQTYLNITPTAYAAAAGQQVLTLDIEPMYRVVASVEETAEALQVKGDDGVTDANAVVLENSETPLDITTLEISVPLPEGFPTENLVVRHEAKDGTYYYVPVITGESPSRIATFTVTHGFSKFTLMADSRSAEITFNGDEMVFGPQNVGDAFPEAEAPNGQTFGGWTLKDSDGNEIDGASGTYTVLTDELLTALDGRKAVATPYFYTASGSVTYAITVDRNLEHGSVTASAGRASRGRTVTVTVKPDSGYTLEGLTVTDKNGSRIKLTDQGSGKYTFTMPASSVNIGATFVRSEDSDGFADVPSDAYYADAVAWAVEQGITTGVTANAFRPDASCTRAQMVTFLWRAAGSPSPKDGNNPFGDVQEDAYYYDAVLWAVEEGIAKGTSADAFSPDAVVTRGQTVTFLYREAGAPAVSGSSFDDVAADAYYADAVAWAVEEGIAKGTGDGAFSPNAACTRAQIVTFLYRAAE